jgi:hypothetical protein
MERLLPLLMRDSSTATDSDPCHSTGTSVGVVCFHNVCALRVSCCWLGGAVFVVVRAL